jgi:tRNA modification GTPase
MHNLSDTVVAVSSPSGGIRSIVRITGPQTHSICERVFVPDPGSQICNPRSAIRNSVILSGQVRINADLAVDGWLYLFFAPRSYTGEDLAEIHVCASRVIVETLVQNLLGRGLRAAGPGEFTARAYLNGKLDLAQAEAVNEIISSSNQLQLEAAEKLLSGRLTKATDEIRVVLLDVLSRIEAGLDFSGEDIEFIGAEEAARRLAAIGQNLEELWAGSIRYETLMDLPAIGIAGAPNAGKSSLLNALLGWERSIVSPQPKTTRDVLSGVLTTDRFQCVLFDCAGLIPVAPPPSGVGAEPSRGRLGCIDELAQQAAIEALQSCSAVLFCVDAAKADLREDVAARALIRPKSIIHVATKTDLLSEADWLQKAGELESVFHAAFKPTSTRTGFGCRSLLDRCAAAVLRGRSPSQPPSGLSNLNSDVSTVALTARHRQVVTDAREQVAQATAEVTRGNEEVAVLMIRAACHALSQIEQQSLDEQVLDRIFSRFCIGK